MGTAESGLDAMLEALGREIKAERVRRSMTRAKLADLASREGREISEKQVGKIERGERGQIHEAWQVALCLGIPLSEMVGRAESQVS